MLRCKRQEGKNFIKFNYKLRFNLISRKKTVRTNLTIHSCNLVEEFRFNSREQLRYLYADKPPLIEFHYYMFQMFAGIFHEILAQDLFRVLNRNLSMDTYLLDWQ